VGEMGKNRDEVSLTGLRRRLKSVVRGAVSVAWWRYEDGTGLREKVGRGTGQED